MSGQLVGVDVLSTSTTALFPLGTIHVTNLGAVYRYMQADGAVSANLLYSIAAGYQIDTLLDLDTPYPADTKAVLIGCTEVAFADNAYGWVFVGPGPFTATAAEDIDATDILYAHGTAGAVSDTTATIFLPGVICQTAILSGATGTLYAAHGLYAVNPA